MKTILLFGISCVGKTTVGKLLADRLGYGFFDLDEETKKYYGMSLEEFVHTGNLRDRDEMRGEVLKYIADLNQDKVVAVTPMSYAYCFSDLLEWDNVIAFVLEDTPENIFERLVFSDENDVVYKDDEYKNAHKEHYLEEIAEDISCYNWNAFRLIGNKCNVNGDKPEIVVERLVDMLGVDDSIEKVLTEVNNGEKT